MDPIGSDRVQKKGSIGLEIGKRGVNWIEYQHNEGSIRSSLAVWGVWGCWKRHPIGLKISKTRDITTEPPYHAPRAKDLYVNQKLIVIENAMCTELSYTLTHQATLSLGSDHLILGEMGLGKCKGWSFLGHGRGVEYFYRPWSGVNICHVLLANIFNKCYEKAVFMKKNNWICVYIKYEFDGSWIFLCVGGGCIFFFYACVKGVVFFFESPTKFSQPTPATIKWLHPYVSCS